MWCPDGYVSWAEVVEQTQRTSEKLVFDICRHAKPHREKFTLKSIEYEVTRAGFAQTEKEAELVVAIVTCWLLCQFMDEYPAKAASLNGSTIKLDWYFSAHFDQLEFCPFHWPLQEASEFHLFFKYMTDGNFDASSLYDRFAFIDFRSGMFKRKNQTECFLLNGLAFEKSEVSEIVSLSDSIRSFASCWDELPSEADLIGYFSRQECETLLEYLPRGYFDMDAAISEDEPRGSPPKLGGGRPEKVETTTRLLRELYPQGIRGVRVKDIIYRLTKEKAYPVSEKTILRAKKAMAEG